MILSIEGEKLHNFMVGEGLAASTELIDGYLHVSVDLGSRSLQAS